MTGQWRLRLAIVRFAPYKCHMTETEPDVPTVVDRMRAVGLSQEFIKEHLAAGHVRVDDEIVTDPGRPAPLPASISIMDV
jgi:hypothetical protein